MEEKTNYLAHHGVKGMRWGVRRYQNTDGSLTDSGRKHYGVKEKRKEKLKKGLKAAAAGAGVAGAAAGAVAVGKTRKNYDRPKREKDTGPTYFDRSIKRGKDKAKASPAEHITRETSNMLENTSTAYSRAKNAIRSTEREIAKQQQAERVKRMSDDDLRKRINRLKLEKQYIDLSSPSYGEGKDVVENILDVAVPLASIAGSAAVIGTTIKGAKNGGGSKIVRVIKNRIKK